MLRVLNSEKAHGGVGLVVLYITCVFKLVEGADVWQATLRIESVLRGTVLGGTRRDLRRISNRRRANATPQLLRALA